MNKFKVGDRVRVFQGVGPYKTGSIVTVKTISEHLDGDVFINGWYDWRFEPLSSSQAHDTVRFILRYELDEDPFETFETMKEVEERIKELSLRPDLKRESIKVYEVAKTYDVSLETRVVFNGLLGPKVKMMEKQERKAPAKRGPKFACWCGEKFSSARGKNVHIGRVHKGAAPQTV